MERFSKITDDINWNIFLEKNKKLKFNEFTAEIFKKLKFDTDPGCINYSNFSKGIMSAAKKSVSCEFKKSPGWFILSKDILAPLMEKRSKVLNLIRQNNFPQDRAINMAKEVKFNLREGIELAKSKWTEVLANIIHDLANSPRGAWKAVTIVKEWIQGHHKSPDIIRLKNSKGNFSESDEETLEILWIHFMNVYNSKVNIDWEVLNELDQKPINNNINVALSWNEFLIAINKLTLHKYQVEMAFRQMQSKLWMMKIKFSFSKFVLVILTTI